MKEEKCEKEFFIKAAKALGWYKIEKQIIKMLRRFFTFLKTN